MDHQAGSPAAEQLDVGVGATLRQTHVRSGFAGTSAVACALITLLLVAACEYADATHHTRDLMGAAGRHRKLASIVQVRTEHRRLRDGPCFSALLMPPAISTRASADNMADESWARELFRDCRHVATVWSGVASGRLRPADLPDYPKGPVGLGTTGPSGSG